MSRYRGPRVKIVRRLGPLPGLTNKLPKTRASYNAQASAKKKRSQYRLRLEEKQKLRFYYGVSERQLLRYVTIARKARGSTGQALLQLLEMRLDNIVFRLGMAGTVPAARQLIGHRHVMVNACAVDIPSYRCRPKDVVSIKDRAVSRTIVDNSLNSHDLAQSKIPSHLRLNRSQQSASVARLVDRECAGVQVNELLVVEYYSRQA